MAYTLPDINFTSGNSGIEQALIYEAQQVHIFGPMLLFFIFFIIMGAGYMSQSRREARGNLSMWAAIAGLITTIISYVLFFYHGIVNLETIVITTMVCVSCVAWFLLAGEY